MRLLLSILVLFAVRASATIIVADSGSRADVGTAVDSAVDGDIVKIPSGSNYWTYSLVTTKQIIIMAEDYTPTEQPFTNATRNVTITWAGTTNYAIHMTSGNSNHCGVGGIKFMPETFANVDDNEEAHDIWGVVHFSGSGTKVPLVFDCHFQSNDRENVSSDEASFLTFDGQGGVVWNTCFDGTRAQSTVSVIGMGGAGIHISSSRSFQTTPTKGTDDTDGIVNVYFEDCYWYQWGQADVDLAGRAVIRYSTLDSSGWQTHGDTSGVSGRHVEMYNNAFENTPTDRNFSRYFWCRGGTVYFTENSVSDNNTGYGTPSQLQAVWEGGGTYLVDYQPGCGHNGSAFVSEPMYIWSQTGNSAYAWGNSSPSYVELDRDIFVNSSTPTYTKYTYPHPAREYIEGDSTPPTLTSATIPSAGTTISLLFDETVNIGSGGNGGWTLDMSGGACTMTYSDGDGSSTLVYSLSRTVEVGETGTIDYTQPTDGVEDNFGNDLANITDDAVTNNSSEGGEPPPTPDMDLFSFAIPGDRHSQSFSDSGYETNHLLQAQFILNHTNDGDWNFVGVFEVGDCFEQEIARWYPGGSFYNTNTLHLTTLTNIWRNLITNGLFVFSVDGNHDADDPTAYEGQDGQSFAGCYTATTNWWTNICPASFYYQQTNYVGGLGYIGSRTFGSGWGQQIAMSYTNGDLKFLFLAYDSSVTGGVAAASEVLPQTQWITNLVGTYHDHNAYVIAHFLLSYRTWATGQGGYSKFWPRLSPHDVLGNVPYWWHGINEIPWSQGLQGFSNVLGTVSGHTRGMSKGHVGVLGTTGNHIIDVHSCNFQSTKVDGLSGAFFGTNFANGRFMSVITVDSINKTCLVRTVDVATSNVLANDSITVHSTPFTGVTNVFKHTWGYPLRVPAAKGRWRLR